MDFTTLLGGLVMLLVFLKAISGYTEIAYHSVLLGVVVLGGLSATLMACRGSELRTLLRLPFKALIIQASDVSDLMETETRRDILALIEEHEAPPQLPPYDLEVIERLSDREVQMLLREVNVRDIVVALKGTSENVRQRIFANVSERVGTMIKEEMNSRRAQSASVRQVVDMQLRMLRTLQLLQERGNVRQNPDAD